jgi:hypothetical protein
MVDIPFIQFLHPFLLKKIIKEVKKRAVKVKNSNYSILEKPYQELLSL